MKEANSKLFGGLMLRIWKVIWVIVLVFSHSSWSALVVGDELVGKSVHGSRAYHALIFNRETGEVVCQASTIARPDWVPGGLAASTLNRNIPAEVWKYPACDATQIQALEFAGRHMRAAARTALVLPLLPVLIWVCAVGGSVGFDSVVTYERSITEYRVDPSALKNDIAVGSLSGAAGGGGLVILSELLNGLHFTWPLAAAGSAGVGLVCGAAGGLGAFMIYYFMDPNL